MLLPPRSRQEVYNIVAPAWASRWLCRRLCQASRGLSKTDLTINETGEGGARMSTRTSSARKPPCPSNFLLPSPKNVTVYRLGLRQRAFLRARNPTANPARAFVAPSGPNIFPGIEVIDRDPPPHPHEPPAVRRRHAWTWITAPIRQQQPPCPLADSSTSLSSSVSSPSSKTPTSRHVRTALA